MEQRQRGPAINISIRGDHIRYIELPPPIYHLFFVESFFESWCNLELPLNQPTLALSTDIKALNRIVRLGLRYTVWLPTHNKCIQRLLSLEHANGESNHYWIVLSRHAIRIRTCYDDGEFRVFVTKTRLMYCRQRIIYGCVLPPIYLTSGRAPQTTEK